MNSSRRVLGSIAQIVVSILLLFFCQICFTQGAQCQDQSGNTQLRLFLESIRENPKGSEVSFKAKMGYIDYSCLENYLEDPNILVRKRAFFIAREYAICTTNTAIQKNFVERVLEQIFEEEGTFDIQNFWLHDFLPEHYSAKARITLGKQLQRALKEYRDGPQRNEWDNLNYSALQAAKRRYWRLNNLIQLVGYSGAKNHMELLGDIKTEFGSVFEDLDKKYVNGGSFMMEIANPWLGTPAWNAALSRARLGSKEDMEFCLDLIEGYPDPGAVEYYILPDIATIVRPEVNAYLYKNLDNESKYWNQLHEISCFRDVVLSWLIKRIGVVDYKRYGNPRSLDKYENMKDYVRMKSDGDPKKLPIKNLRRERFESSRKRFIASAK